MYFIASNAFFLIFSHQTNEKGLVTLFSEPSLGDGNNGGLPSDAIMTDFYKYFFDVSRLKLYCF
jgi:hypothetical protein